MESAQFERTREYWGRTIQKGNLIYPNDQVIRFVKKNFSIPEQTTILDFGCGGGRNTIALLNEGPHVSAMDYTDSAIKIIEKKCYCMAGGGNRNVRIVQNHGFEIPLENSSVDAVVADGSLFYYNADDIIKVMKNLCRVMKPKSLLWTDFRTKKDSLYGKGTPIADGLFDMGKGTGRENCTYYFADEKDIRYIFSSSGFIIVSLDDFSYTVNNRTSINSWFHIVAQNK